MNKQIDLNHDYLQGTLNEDDINHYIEDEKKALRNLKISLERLVAESTDPEAAKQTIVRFIKKLNNALSNKNLFLYEKANFERHPRLWSNTSRNGATRIKDDGTPSTYDEIETILKSLQLPVTSTHKIFHFAKKEIKQPKDEHHNLRKNQKRHFLYQAKNYTINQLEELFALVPESKQNEDYRNLLKRLALIKQMAIKTTKDALIQHRNIYFLTKDLKRYYKNELSQLNNETINKEFLMLTELFSVVSKRWIDPYFKNPKLDQYTNMDKLRTKLKASSLLTAGIIGAIGFVLLFTPFAPLSLIFGIVGAVIGSIPLTDTAINVIDNAVRFKRSPLNLQAFELKAAVVGVIAIVAVSHLTNIAHALILLGKIIGNKAHSVLSSIAGPLSFTSNASVVVGMNGVKTLGAGVKNMANAIYYVKDIKKQTKNTPSILLEEADLDIQNHSQYNSPLVQMGFFRKPSSSNSLDRYKNMDTGVMDVQTSLYPAMRG